MLADTGPHVLDLLLWWFEGEKPLLGRYADSSVGGVEAEAELSMRLGPTEVEVTMTRLRWQSNTCRLVGTEGTVEIGLDCIADYILKDHLGTVLERGTVPAGVEPQEQWELCFAEQAENLVAAARGEQEIWVGGEDGLAVVDLVERCYQERQTLDFSWREVTA